MNADKQEFRSRQRKFVVPLMVAAFLTATAHLILKPDNSVLVIASMVLTWGALIVALFINKASAKTWALVCGGILLAVTVGVILGFVLT